MFEKLNGEWAPAKRRRVVAAIAVVLSLGVTHAAQAVDARTGWPVPHHATGVRNVAQPFAYVGPMGNPGLDPAPDGQSPVYFDIDAYQYVDATFISGDFTQSRPSLGIDSHSFASIAARSNFDLDSVQIGWIVQSDDPEPQLFVFHFVEGEPTCYNGCGYVQLSATRAPGMHVDVTDTPQSYAIQYADGDWYVGYQGEWIGYFPGSEWNGRFVAMDHAQWYAEVAAANRWPCAEMGNGAFADQEGAASISNLAVDGAPADSLPGIVHFPVAYSSGGATPTSFYYGGPGLCYDEQFIFYDDFNYRS